MPIDLPEVTVADIPKFYAGELEDFSEEFLANKLGEVVDTIKDRFGTQVAQRLASGRLTDRLYRAVVVRIASRVFANAEGFEKENGGQYGYELNPAVASGTIWFTDDDYRDLAGVDRRKSNVIGTAGVGRHRPGRTW